MKRRAIWVLTALLLFISGCTFYSGDDLLAAPQPSKNYLALDAELKSVLNTGAVYATPQSGENRSYVQIMDLDADGEDEVISFFRQSDGASTFHIYLHKKIGDKYVRMGMVEGYGTAIQKVDYPTLTTGGARGIVVSWKQAGSTNNALSVITFENGALQTVLNTEYTAYQLFDLTDSGTADLFTLTFTATDKSAKLYTYRDQKMTRLGEAAVSREAQSVARLTRGYCANGQPAVFAEEKTENGAGLMTDVFVFEEHQMHNLTMLTEQSGTPGTYRTMSIYATDINGDGITEVPSAALMAGYRDPAATDALFLLNWYALDTNGAATLACTTYHNVAEEWRLMLPDGWRGKVTAAKGVNSAGNTYTIFSEYRDGSTNIDLLYIYAFSGDMAEYLAKREGLIYLGKNDAVYYAAVIPQGAEASAFAITQEQLTKAFGVLNAGGWNG